MFSKADFVKDMNNFIIVHTFSFRCNIFQWYCGKRINVTRSFLMFYATFNYILAH